MIKYGSPPTVIGNYDLSITEMMFYLYLPVSIPGQYQAMPRRLSSLEHMIYHFELFKTSKKYVYVTAKTMPVTPQSPGNRPGWHADGYGSNGDINYIWYDKNPTEFAVQEFANIPDDDELSMKAFEAQADNIVTFPCKTLIRLDESVVHRVGPVVESGIRTFIKITLSDHKLNRVGNSINYALDYSWPMAERQPERNLDHG